MTTTVADRPSPRGARRALLIDLDNIGLPSDGAARENLAALVEAAGPCADQIAAGRDCSFAAYRDVCVELGITVHEVPGVNDAADAVLLAGAGALYARGVREFVVLSGDHAFAALPGAVHVVVPSGRSLSEELARRSTSVMRVRVRSVPSRAKLSRNARRARSRARVARQAAGEES